MAARKYSVGIGPVPVPPALGGSSTTRSNPPAVTRHRQPPSHRATTELVRGPSAGVPGASGRPSGVMVMAMRAAARLVLRRAGGQHRGPGAQLGIGHQAALACQPLQRPQPAAVVAPVPGGLAASLPGPDLADQRLPEILP